MLETCEMPCIKVSPKDANHKKTQRLRPTSHLNRGASMIDTHIHLWQIGKNGHVWPQEDLGQIFRDFGLDDLREASGDTGSISYLAVQSQPSEADTRWLLDVAEASDAICGVVGWVDMMSLDAPKKIAALSQRGKLKGLRPMLQNIPDPSWILKPDVGPSLNVMTDNELVLDALIYTQHLVSVTRLAQLRPGLKIVIDHAAKPPIGDAEATRVWREHMQRASEFANVSVKLSGLITEAAPGAELDAIEPYADFLLETFGAERLVWGSDWPVVNLQSSWRAWREWCSAWASGFGLEVERAVLHDNAARVYNISKP